MNSSLETEWVWSILTTVEHTQGTYNVLIICQFNYLIQPAWLACGNTQQAICIASVSFFIIPKVKVNRYELCRGH